ncbi:MAG: MaoC/PaaZ C-terminal domain-containing protein [Actinomycetes bacterium]
MGKVTRVDRPAPSAELYAKAVAGTVLPGLLWGGGTALPEEVLERTLTPNRDDLLAYDEVCGYALTDLLPLTYPHVLGFPLSMQIMTGRSFPLPVLGMVHVANTITVHQPVPTGAELTVRVHAEGPFAHKRGTEVDLVTQVLVGGELCWEESSTYLCKGSKLADHQGLVERPRIDWPVPTDGAQAREVRVDGDIGRRYASVSGDRNPIHTHSLGARAFGFKGVIAQGMWTLARSLAEAGLPEEAPYRVAAAFWKPVFLPADVRVLTATEGGQLRVWLTGQTSETIHVVATVDRI